MAASDVSILAAGAEALPLTYTIPPTQAFQVKAASASFDGTGASGTFTPVLTIRNDAGLVVARCLDASQTTTAGGSVEPSWFPHVAAAAAASPAGAGNLPYLYATRSGLTINDATSTTVDLDPAAGAVTWGSSDTGILTLAPSGGFNGPEFVVDGEYLCYSFAFFDKAGAPPAGGAATCGMSGAAITVGGANPCVWASNLAGTATGAHPTRVDVFNLPTAYALTPYISTLVIGQKTGGAVTGVTAGVFVVRINDTGNTNY